MVQESILQQHLDRVLDRSEEQYRTPIRKTLIQDEDHFNYFLGQLEDTEGFAYDTETNGQFDRFKVELVGISFAVDDEPEPVAYYIPLNHFEGTQLDINYALKRLKPYFESEDRFKICHNAKFDEMVLSTYGIEVKGKGHDTFVMAWLLADDTSSKGLKQLVEKHFDVEMETYEDVISSAPKKKGVPRDYNFGRVGLESALSYAADDAYWTYKLFKMFSEQLKAQKLWAAYDNIERPFVRILRHLEATGVLIDQEYMREADERLPKIIEEVEHEIYEQAGEVFNIGSGAQLGKVLFEKLGIGKNVPKTPKGDYSTNKKTLENYSTHKIVENVLRRKKIKKNHSSFVTGLQKFIAEDGRIHASFNGCGTVTGRLSSSSPNLQQIEGDEVEEIKARNFFVAAPGYKFVVADYGQIELRLMAHFSKDKNMLEAFASGRDFHEETARGMLNVPDERDVLHRERFIAKSLNFGVGYGRGPMGISEQLGISMGEAQEFINQWWENFPQLRAYKEKLLMQARKYGYIRTISGRKRRVPDILSREWMLRGRAERQAFNTKVQGSAADLIKLAMIALEPKLDDIGARMCIQIHDELVIEAPSDEAEEVLELTKDTMSNPLNGTNPLILPLAVSPQICAKWGEGK